MFRHEKEVEVLEEEYEATEESSSDDRGYVELFDDIPGYKGWY